MADEQFGEEQRCKYDVVLDIEYASTVDNLKPQVDISIPLGASDSDAQDKYESTSRQSHYSTRDISHDDSCSTNKQLVLAQVSHTRPERIYWPGKSHYFKDFDSDDEDDVEQHGSKSSIDHAWSRRILELVGNKSKLLESFSWLSTVGGGYSALGESDQKFSSRAGALSLGQQLKLADLLGDERLRVMCHLFAALAALQMNNKQFCLNYIRRVILPLIHAMPYRDPLLTNILKHICFRMSTLDRYIGARRQNAIEASRKTTGNGTSALSK